jgi:hypothetical protein
MAWWDDGENQGGGWHDVAQICVSGHVINSASQDKPQFNQKFCNRCGKATITQCPVCNGAIQGEYHAQGLTVIGEEWPPPAFCQRCGEAYPWTTASLEAARELTSELDNLSDSEKQILSRSLDDLIRDTPSTPVAATRFKKLAVKAGKEGAGALKDILVDLISETAKKVIWPNS